MNTDPSEAFILINSFAWSVAEYVKRPKATMTDLTNMERHANELYRAMTGKRMPREERDKILA